MENSIDIKMQQYISEVAKQKENQQPLHFKSKCIPIDILLSKINTHLVLNCRLQNSEMQP